ncbi:MAG: HDOD domain-containing protein [Desulfobacteraceae bacterium]
MKTDHKIKTFLSQSLTEKELTSLYKNAEIKKFNRQQTVIHQGEAEQEMYIILKGKIKIVKTINGIKRTLSVLESGDIFGEISFLHNKTRTATAVALDPTDLMIIDKTTFEKFDTAIQLHFYKYISQSALERLQQIETQKKSLELKNRKLITKTFLSSTQKTKEIQGSDLINEIIAKIPRLPTFTLSLIIRISSGEISPREVARQVSQDPSLAGTILKTINSSFYALRKEVTDIHHAIMLLGYNEVTQIVVANGVRKVMPKSREFNSLYEHSLAVCHIASILSFGLNIGKPAEIGTIGLMHEFGQLVILLLKSRNKKIGPLFDLADSSQMGKELLKSWQIPSIIYKSIEYQFYPDFSPPDLIPEEVRDNVILLYLSHLCWDYLKNSDTETLSLLFFDEYIEIMHFKKQRFHDFFTKKALPMIVRKKKSLPNPLLNRVYTYQKNKSV